MTGQVKILFTGDFCPQLRVEALTRQGRYDMIFNDFIDELKASDFNIVDLECPLTHRTTGIPKTGPHLKGDPDAVKALQYGHIHAVALANNHIKDYGEAGLLETINYCEQAGIKTFGAGKNLDEARKPLLLEKYGVRVGVLNVTENEWSNTYGNQAGANPLDLIKNVNDIKEARKDNDFVVVVYHGGNEFYELPSPRLKETLRFFVDAGASAVIAHHAHIISGYEVYDQAPIFYGLGNFCFDWPGQRSSFWNLGLAVRLNFEKGYAVSFELLPVRQNDAEAGIRSLSASEKEIFHANLNQLNEIIAHDPDLVARFKKFCLEKKVNYELYMEPYRSNLLASLYKRGLIPSFFSKHKRRLHRNVMRCESHRDVMLEILKQHDNG